MNIQGITPVMMAPVKSASAVGAQAASGSNGSGSSATSPTDLQSTFLNLLVTELQNQDPTSPVDPTQMVSQMVSLNQLDQLISINQTLSSMLPTTAATPSSGLATAARSLSSVPTSQTNLAATSNRISPPSTTPSQEPVPVALPVDSGLMNLYGSYSLMHPNTNSTYKGVR